MKVVENLQIMKGTSDDSTMSDEEFEDFSNNILNGTSPTSGGDELQLVVMEWMLKIYLII